MKKGFVSLVGAGPGDPELLTLKARRCLEEADWIIYDYLVNPEHLRWAKPGSVKLCVGKGFRHKKMSQKRIHEKILKQAASGKKIVRLKGGDPYLFGRGGEEALFLKNHNIAFEAVPGVTSATAVANYAGIPLTHREHNESVTLLTGHRASDRDLDSIDWNRIARLPGTLVIYMGLYNLPVIAKKLIQAGMRKEMPAAVVEWGTLPAQKKTVGNLANIAGRVAEAGLKPPCLILIGKVVALSDELNWFEKLPLFGKKIWVTRMREKAGLLGDELRRLGGAVREFPLISVGPPTNFKALDKAIRRLCDFDWVVFTSSYGVRYFMERLFIAGGDVRSLALCRVVCVGSETAKALREYGLRADVVPKDAQASGIPSSIQKKFGSLRGKALLLPRADIAPGELEKKLAELGARPCRATAYRTRPDRDGIRRLLSEKEIPDFLLFTSSSAAHEWAKALGVARARTVSKKTSVISIGPVTTQTLKKLGVRVAAQAASPSISGITRAVLTKCKKGK